MKTYLFRAGDGNEGNFRRGTVNLVESDCPYAALRALVLNMYKLGPLRSHIASEIETDGEAEYGILATVFEGPNGETAFGAAYITAELVPEEEHDPDAPILGQLLDSAACDDYAAQLRRKGGPQ